MLSLYDADLRERKKTSAWPVVNSGPQQMHTPQESPSLTCRNVSAHATQTKGDQANMAHMSHLSAGLNP